MVKITVCGRCDTAVTASVKPGFHPTQRTQRKGRKELRNEMTSLLDRPITAASDDGVCRWYTAKLWQTCAKLLKLNSTCIISCTTSKNVITFGLLIFLIVNLKKKLEFSRKEDSSVPIGWSLRLLRELRSVRCVRCVGWKPPLGLAIDMRYRVMG